MNTFVFHGLGRALRWLRERRDLKQYEVAKGAGVTKGMLSAYESGRTRPSAETLEKILEYLRYDLNDLHNAIQIANGQPGKMKRRGEGMDQDAYLLTPGPLDQRKESAFTEILDRFYHLLRYFSDRIEEISPQQD